MEITTERKRGVPYARVWTARRETLFLAEIADALTARGFVPGFTNPEGTSAPLSEVGLAEVRLAAGEPGYRVISLASSKGGGCRIAVREATPEDGPEDYLARRAVPKPRLIYLLEAGGPSNSDRHLSEHLAEVLMVLANGAVEIGGLGTKGNKPVVHTNNWLGTIRA